MEAFDNESVESKGTNLEKVYSSLLEGKIVGGIGDGGIDIVLENNPDIPIVQVKSSLAMARKFLAESLRRNEFIPMVIGDPGQYTKEDIMISLIENGGWVGIDEPDGEKFVENIKKLRDHILQEGGTIKRE